MAVLERTISRRMGQKFEAVSPRGDVRVLRTSEIEITVTDINAVTQALDIRGRISGNGSGDARIIRVVAPVVSSLPDGGLRFSEKGSKTMEPGKVVDLIRDRIEIVRPRTEGNGSNS